MKNRQVNNLILILVVFISSGCASFSPIPKHVNTSNEFVGTYSNDPCLNPFGDYRMWDLVDYKTSVEIDSLFVKVSQIDKKRFQFQLQNEDSIIAVKDLKIKRKEDSCYYTKRRFFIIPILPIIWAYSNHQKRFIVGNETVIIERTSNSGGAMIFMAGGDKYNDSWEYKKKKKSR